MSDLTQEIRRFPWGAKLLDDVEAAETAVKEAVSNPTTENLVKAAGLSATATATVTSTASTILANPVPTGELLIEDAITLFGNTIAATLSAKFGSAASVPVKDISILLGQVQALILSKL
jgi:hypothetical protein